MTIKDEISELYPEALFMDGFDDAIMGVIDRFGSEYAVIYDRTKVIEINMDCGCTEEEAIEFYEYNQLGAYMGEHTPCFCVGFK